MAPCAPRHTASDPRGYTRIALGVAAGGTPLPTAMSGVDTTVGSVKGKVALAVVGCSRISILPDERMGPSASRGAVHTSIKDFAHLAGVGRCWPLQEPFQGSLVL